MDAGDISGLIDKSKEYVRLIFQKASIIIILMKEGSNLYAGLLLFHFFECSVKHLTFQYRDCSAPHQGDGWRIMMTHA